MIQIDALQTASAHLAIEKLCARSNEFRYFSLTWHEVKGWECHLNLSYSGTQFVDKFGSHVIDIYSYAYDSDAVTAVDRAIAVLHQRAQEKLEMRNSSPAVEPAPAEADVSSILKELGL